MQKAISAAQYFRKSIRLQCGHKNSAQHFLNPMLLGALRTACKRCIRYQFYTSSKPRINFISEPHQFNIICLMPFSVSLCIPVLSFLKYIIYKLPFPIFYNLQLFYNFFWNQTEIRTFWKPQLFIH